MKQTFLIIDALNLIRRIFAVNQKHNTSSANHILACKKSVRYALQKLLNILDASHAVAILDGNKSWRHHYFSDYKKSRSAMPDNLHSHLDQVMDIFIEQGITVYKPDNDEADDVIATLAHKAKSKNIHTTIVSTDKGFLPHLDSCVNIFDYFKRRAIDEQYVYEKFDLNKEHLVDFWALSGDKTNDIPGVNGIGSKTALKLLKEYGSITHALNNDSLTKSVRIKFLKDEDNYILSKHLVTLRTDITLGFNLNDLRLHKQNHHNMSK